MERKTAYLVDGDVDREVRVGKLVIKVWRPRPVTPEYVGQFISISCGDEDPGADGVLELLVPRENVDAVCKALQHSSFVAQMAVPENATVPIIA